jgi:periplasmic protein TonB
MIARGEFAFAGAPAAARFAPPDRDLRFWIAAFAVAILLHAAAVVALLGHRSPPPAQQDAMIVELAPLVQTIEQSQPVLPEPKPEIKAAPPPPPPIVQPEPAPEPPPVIESETEIVAAPPIPKPRPKAPQPAQPQVTAPPEPVREPEFSSWSALERPSPQPSQAVQRRVTLAPNEYLTRIHAQMERYKIYPRPARARGIEGLVQLVFIIDRGGHVVSHHIVRGSGYEVLDRAVDDMIKRASPFPPFPAGMQGDELEIAMAVSFYIR